MKAVLHAVFHQMFLALLKAIHSCVCSHRNVPSINFITTVQTKDLRVFYWKWLSEKQIIVMKIKYCYTIVCFPCLILKTAFFLSSVKFPPVCFIKCSKLHSLPSSRQHQDRNSHWQKQLVQNQAHSSSTSRENTGSTWAVGKQ